MTDTQVLLLNKQASSQINTPKIFTIILVFILTLILNIDSCFAKIDVRLEYKLNSRLGGIQAEYFSIKTRIKSII